MKCESGIDLQTIETMVELSKFEEQAKSKLNTELMKFKPNLDSKLIKLSTQNC